MRLSAREVSAEVSGALRAVAKFLNLCYNNQNNNILRPTPEKTYLIGESAFRSHVGDEQHG